MIMYKVNGIVSIVRGNRDSLDPWIKRHVTPSKTQMVNSFSCHWENSPVSKLCERLVFSFIVQDKPIAEVLAKANEQALSKVDRVVNVGFSTEKTDIDIGDTVYHYSKGM